MSATEQTPTPVFWDAPNQQVVRADESPPWEEGTGGGEAAAAASTDLESMTKDQLLAKAKEMGVSPANNDMTKAELIDGIRAAGG